MTLILRPLGRGAWHTIELRLNGNRAPALPLFGYQRGQRIDVDGRTYRVVEVRR